ncbi:hypothetical protein LTR85_003039 [Meristemomyces frigidus]|nr:hypothetical protein LTR85_003039 [Meristemomyces frigidus]
MARTTPPIHHDQTNHLTGKPLALAVIALNFANAVAFMDILGIPVLLPVIAQHLNAAQTITWAATSQLVSATVGQCILGYISDLFGRKKMLQTALSLLMVGTLACGLCSLTKSAPLFYACRAITGVATGSISNLVNVAQNDFCTAKQRANLQGVQGASVALGSALGLLVSAALAQKDGGPVATWQFLYYIECILAGVALLIISLCVPSKIATPSQQEVWKCIKTIDWAGILLGTATIVPALILLTEGRTFGFKSPACIALMVIAAMSCIGFLVTGFTQPFKRYGVRPIVPFHLFSNRTICMIYVQNILLGDAYYAFIVFFPMYWQLIAGFSPLKTASLMLPYLVTHGAWSTVSAKVVGMLAARHTGAKSFSYIFFLGFTLWAAAMLIFASVPHNMNVGAVVILEIMVGMGTGGVFQNSVNAIRTQVTAEDNAVAIGTRNVVRFFGGSMGTAISTTIMEVVARRELPSRLAYLAGSIFTKPDTNNLTPADKAAEHRAYSVGMRSVFLAAGIAISICLVLTFFIQDPGPAPKTKSQPSDSGLEKDSDLFAITTPSSGLSTRKGSAVDLSSTEASSRRDSFVDVELAVIPAERV